MGRDRWICPPKRAVVGPGGSAVARPLHDLGLGVTEELLEGVVRRGDAGGDVRRLAHIELLLESHGASLTVSTLAGS